jgi:addiction module RelB/DinJ family antitoxin
MKSDTMISIRVNEEMKKQAAIIAESAGMTLSGVFKAMLAQMVSKKQIPFEIQSTLPEKRELHEATDVAGLSHREAVLKAALEVMSENSEALKELAK